MKKYVIAALLGTGAIGAAMVAAVPTAYAIPVFDSANYSQNLLTAARKLQQINQQIQSLQNEAQKMVNQSKNPTRHDFPQLDPITPTPRQINHTHRESYSERMCT